MPSPTDRTAGEIATDGKERAVCPECGHVSSFNGPGDSVFCPEIGTTVELVARSVDTGDDRQGGDGA